MTTLYKTTNLGRAVFANTGFGSQNLATIKVSTVNNDYNESSEVFLNSLKTLPISGLVLNGAAIHLTFGDTSTDAYECRSIGIFLEDGTLFATTSSETPLFEKVAGSTLVQSIDFVLADLSGEEFDFPPATISNPPATETNSGVARFATIAEARVGTSSNLIISPSKLKDYIDKRIQDGIDAALLGGKNRAWFEDIVGRLGFIPAPLSAISGIWTSFNDGPNSGLDADLLDGKHATDFALSSLFSASLEANGFAKLAAGENQLILQWAEGESSISNEEASTVTFPIPFPNACLFVQVGTKAFGATYASNVWYQLVNKSLTNCQVMRQVAGSAGAYDNVLTAPLILAIGY